VQCSTLLLYEGDDEPGPDPWVVTPDEVVGVWTGFRIPYLGMSFICLRQDAQCPSPWGPLSIIVLGGVVGSDLVFERWLSRRSAKKPMLSEEVQQAISG